MLTYQDFQSTADVPAFIASAIAEHMRGAAYREAVLADRYDRQQGFAACDAPGTQDVGDVSAAATGESRGAAQPGSRIPSNLFHQLNVQRCAYLLGNGVRFTGGPATKALLGKRFDRDFYELGRLALIHGTSFALWNEGRLHLFPITQFAPLYDERTGALRAGIRFWQLDARRPVRAVLYDEDGVTDFECDADYRGMTEVCAKRPYLIRGLETAAGGFEVTARENYPRLPVIVMHGSALKQSTLVGMRAQIDSYDRVQSSFADDLMNCSQIYWIIDNCGGMREADLRSFMRRLARDHVAVADTRGMGAEAGGLKPYVQEVPFEARVAWLKFIRASIYEGFGALDVQALSSGQRTATEIAAAYQPLDAAADDFEAQCTAAIHQLLDILGVDDEPVYKRDRVANAYEQTRTVMLAKDVLDRAAIVRHLPWVTVDEAEEILGNRQ